MTLNPLKIKSLQLHDLHHIVQLCHFYPELNWNEAKLKGSLANSEVLAFGLFKNDALIGALILNLIEAEAELLLVVTHPDFVRQGCAVKLLKYVNNELIRQGIHRVFLEVRASNEAAIKLYEALGFKYIYVRKDYYANPKEDALIMELSFADN